MSEQFLATASVRIVPDVTGFAAALQAEVAAATARVRIPAVAGALAANTTATRTFTAATGVSTLAVKANADALIVEGAAAGEEAAAIGKSAAAAAASARAHEQLARGGFATALSLLGIRGATLAAGTAFLAGAAAITILSKSVKEAIADQESLFRVTRILGTELGEGSRRWSESLANSFGLSSDAALKFEGAIAETFHNVGLGADQNVKLSESFVKLAADLAAFAHVPVEQTLRGLQLSISGNTRALRQYGVVIQNTEVQQEALRETGKKSTDELTRQELTMARLALIQDRLSNVVGSFAANQGSLANQSRILSSNLANLGVKIGDALIPALNTIVGEVTKTVHGFELLINIAKKIPLPVENADGSTNLFGQSLHALGIVAKGSVFPLASIIDRVDQMAIRLGLVTPKVDEFTHGLNQISFAKLMGDIPLVTNMLDRLSGAFDRAAAKFRQGLFLQITVATQAVGAANTALLRIQAEGGSLQAQLGAAQNALDKAEAASAAADKASGITGGATAQKKALQDELQARQVRDSLQGQIDAANKKDAAGAKKAGKTRQEILDEQDQALLDEQQFNQGQLDLAQARADSNKSFADDIVVAKKRIALDEQQIAQAKAQIHDEQLKKTTIQGLRIAEQNTRNELKKLEEDRAQAARDRAKVIEDRKKERLDLDIQIAEANKNIAAERRALQARIAFDRIQLQNVHGDLVRKKQLQLEIAQDTQTLKDLKKEQANNANVAAALQFQFLQTQQGFVANLLGNLIPTGATAGLVGGPTSGAISTATSVPGFAATEHGSGGFGTPGGDLASATRTAAGVRGASAGQMSTLIHINSQMLAALMRLSGRGAAPEAGRQHWWTATPFTDTFGW